MNRARHAASDMLRPSCCARNTVPVLLCTYCCIRRSTAARLRPSRRDRNVMFVMSHLTVGARLLARATLRSSRGALQVAPNLSFPPCCAAEWPPSCCPHDAAPVTLHLSQLLPKKSAPTIKSNLEDQGQTTGGPLVSRCGQALSATGVSFRAPTSPQ